MNIWLAVTAEELQAEYLQFSASSRGCVTLMLHLRLKG